MRKSSSITEYRKASNKKSLLGLLSIILLPALSLSSCATKSLTNKIPSHSQKNNSQEGYLEVNSEKPGEEINIKSSIVYGKYTIIDFSSPFCGPCQQLKPFLQQLHSKRPDIVVRAFDINREGSQGIDWQSPLAQQYNLRSVPYFKIFNEKGVQIAEGRDATQQVIAVINKELFRKEN